MVSDKLKMNAGIFVILVSTIVTSGSSFSYPLVAALTSESSIDHQNAFVKKQETRSHADDVVNSKDKSSADSNDNGGSSENLQQDSSDVSNSGRSSTGSSDITNSDNSDNSDKTGDTRSNIAAPNRPCDEQSSCDNQQDPSDTDNPVAPSARKQGDTPFVLSLPFP